MPSKNINKIQSPDSYYHVYARGNNKQIIFIDDKDYKYFLMLFDRYISYDPVINKIGGIYPSYVDKIEILAYCLMPTHFHILIYQIDIPYLEKFMRSLMTSYSRYFNLRHKRTGSIYESCYKAVRIDQESYLQHITRYIHLNPKRWQHYKYSSFKFYQNGNAPIWLTTGKILEQFNSVQEYIDFVADYEEMHDTLHEIKDQLANK